MFEIFYFSQSSRKYLWLVSVVLYYNELRVQSRQTVLCILFTTVAISILVWSFLRFMELTPSLAMVDVMKTKTIVCQKEKKMDQWN